MSPERWQKMEELYHAAFECAEDQRVAFVNAACSDDEELRRELIGLLDAHTQSGGLLEMPPEDVAADMIASAEKKAMIGRIFNHYQVIALIGEGGMGKVYLARDTQLGRKVALKLLPQEFTEDRERVQRFQQEARSVSALNHPNILTVYEVGQMDGLHFIVTEFIDGQTLRQRIASGRMELPDALEIAAQVASALGAAHDAGIVHRDIKPENVMIRRDGFVKVLDFGIAKLIESARAQVTTITNDRLSHVELVHTERGLTPGTPRYMSPEQIRGQEIDGRSDLFSLGVMLFEMISGCQPFGGNTPYESAAEILHREVPLLRELRPETPAEIERIASKALAKDRNERYKSARDLMTDLKNLKFELEVENRDKLSASLVQSLQINSRKPGRIVFLVGLIALLVIGVFAYRFYFQQPDGAIENANQQVAVPPTVENIEIIRYSLGVEIANGNVTRTTNQILLSAGQKFRFHFTPRARGYLYIVGPGKGNIPRTFLTAEPLRSTGVTTNHLESGVEYSFPLGPGNAIQLGAAGTNNNFTIIFSPTQLSQPAFLAARANRQLTEPEQHEMAAFWEHYAKRTAELRPDEGLKQVIVSVPADRNPDEPLIFEISVKRQ